MFHWLLSASAGHIYKLCAKHTSNSGFDWTFSAQAIFYALPNNEWGTKHRGLTYSAKQTVRETCRATYSASQTRLRIYLTVSITAVQSIDTPNHPKTPKTPQTSTKPKPLPYILAISYNAQIFRTLMSFSGGGGPGSSTGIVHTGIGLNNRQLFWKANTCKSSWVSEIGNVPFLSSHLGEG